MDNERTETAPYWFNSSAEFAFSQNRENRYYGLKYGRANQGKNLVMGHLRQAITISPTSAGARLYFRTCLPYCIEESGMILNREYKPIGVGGTSIANFVDYELFSMTHVLEGHREKEKLWFYNDANVPWHSVKCRRDYMYRVIKFFEPRVLPTMERHGLAGEYQ
jgi:hypothetical protein